MLGSDETGGKRRRSRRLGDPDAYQAADAWRQQLGIRQAVSLVRIRPHQVADATGRRGRSLVGVAHDEEVARIFHTRRLTLEDIVHELLHVANPHWSEADVVVGTEALLALLASDTESAASGA